MTQVDPAFYAAGIVLPGPTSAANATGQIPVWNDTGWDAWLGTWDGTFLVLPALAVTDLTAARIPYVSTSGRLADNANLVWDNTNSRLGVGVAAPAAAIHAIKTTEQLRLGYDASVYATFTQNSAGLLTVTSTGGKILLPFTTFFGTDDVTTGAGFVQRRISTSGTVFYGSAALDQWFGTGNASNAIAFGNDYTGYSRLILRNTGAIFNYDTQDVDFTVKGDTDASLFVCDAGTDSVLVGTATPVSGFKLAVSGAVNATGAISAGPITFSVLNALTATATLGVYRITDRGNKLAYPDGTNWRFVGDDAIIS